MGQFFGQLALVAAAAFAGAAIYINVAEHPARMVLDPASQLAHWKPSYASALRMQVGLAIGSVVLALAAAWASGDWRWTVGGIVMLANLPFTLVVIMPTNHILNATREAEAGAATRALLDRWARLHAMRGGLGLVATAAYIWAALSSFSG